MVTPDSEAPWMQAATRDPAIDIRSIRRERVRLDRAIDRLILAR